jgi:Fe-S-cluster containining protein
MRAGLHEQAATDVPCGSCCACCSTSHFVHVAADERDVLALIPRELRFPAPGLPSGHVVLPYDERGRCPMLAADGRCSVYEHRPRTCRVYDCRVFAAAGIDADRDAITAQARRWRFTYPAEQDREEHHAVRAAARFVRDHAAAFAPGFAADAPRLAVLAVEVSQLFLARGRATDGEAVPPDAALIAAIERAARRLVP